MNRSKREKFFNCFKVPYIDSIQGITILTPGGSFMVKGLFDMELISKRSVTNWRSVRLRWVFTSTLLKIAAGSAAMKELALVFETGR